MKILIISMIMLFVSQFQFTFAANTATNTKLESSSISNYQKALNQAQLLYVINGDKGSIKLINKQKRLYEITINDVDPSMTYFANRPSRITGRMPTDYFVQQWGEGANSFAENPPNAAFEASHGNRQLDYVFELQQPNYHKQTKSLSFRAILLSGKLADTVESLKSINLFIDFHWHNSIP